MAWIEKKKRRHGGVSARVVWRLGGTRGGAYQSETFSAGTDAQNVARADGFKKMVDAGGQRWPDGWVKGEGFVRPAGTDPLTAPSRFVDLGEEYVRQIVDLSPGQQKRYLGHLRVLGETTVRGSRRLLRRRPSPDHRGRLLTRSGDRATGVSECGALRRTVDVVSRPVVMLEARRIVLRCGR